MTTSLSAVPLRERCAVVFDLDDTLYLEREFVQSGFRAVADLVERESGVGIFSRLIDLFDARHHDPFAAVISDFRLPPWKSRFIAAYREHVPDVKLDDEVRNLLTDLRAAGHEIAIMTDGRSLTQRNKIRALGLERSVTAIVISEEFGSAKPAERNYRYFERLFPNRPLAYVGNDLTKDFVTANRLGWQTVCVLDQGEQIRPQQFDLTSTEALPQFMVERLA